MKKWGILLLALLLMSTASALADTIQVPAYASDVPQGELGMWGQPNAYVMFPGDQGIKDCDQLTAYYLPNGDLEYYNINYVLEGSTLNMSCDPLGNIIYANFSANGQPYSFDGVSWWDEKGMDPLENAPEDFDRAALTQVTLYPQAAADALTAKMQSIADSVPLLPPQGDLGTLTLEDFPPMPILSCEPQEDGGLVFALTGVDAWGLKSQHITVQYNRGARQHTPEPALPADQLLVYIPASEVGAWNGSFVLDSLLGSGYVVFLVDADTCHYSMEYHFDSQNMYVFSMQDLPMLLKCQYRKDGQIVHHDLMASVSLDDLIFDGYTAGNKEVTCTMTADGQVLDYQVLLISENGEVTAFADYTAEGQLICLTLVSEPYSYWPEEGWLEDSDGKLVPCDYTGMDISDWLTVPARPEE